MNITLVLAGAGIAAAGGLAALVVADRPRWASRLGGCSAAIGCGMALIPVIGVLAGDRITSFSMPWPVPFGSFTIGLDTLSAFFLLPILLLCGLAAVYGTEYLQTYAGRKPLGPAWFMFGLLVGSMVLLVIARNAVLFLVAWEVMSLSSFFLVTFEHERAEVRRAGWTYLVATHLGTSCLLAAFVLLSTGSESMHFAALAGADRAATVRDGAVFILVLIGFGTKAGFMPFHVWLPEAHPAAPSHVSAIMSGVMIKTGLYGLLRVLTFLGPPPAWWGCVLIGIGLVSGILGVLFALAQTDLKRVLAYSSVENVGIIAMALGIGLLGVSLGSTPMAVLGFGGGLLHVLNHACFKGLLFLGAGAVAHGTGTRNVELLGGLLKRMPWSGWTFLVGSVAICGLPPLNGFVSELLVYLGALQGARSIDPAYVLLPVGVLAGLALIGGLALACFTRAFGIAFLGESRSESAAHAHECGWRMRAPMLILAACCVALSLLAPMVFGVLTPAIARVSGLPEPQVRAAMTGPQSWLFTVAISSLVLLALATGLVMLGRRLLSKRPVTTTVTWGCGYARPTARMQYTASSFAQPLTACFRLFLGTRESLYPPDGYFPASASLATRTEDVCRERLYSPVFRGLAWLLAKLRWLQHGRVQIYVLYIAFTLLALLIWKLG
ncbi:MAG TPA: proton-conducting transporter membrane subunit [Phycisphaerae bacterium]|nr:proton-conducting transporter membrane subunit [Phycisphaerae bacterium]